MYLFFGFFGVVYESFTSTFLKTQMYFGKMSRMN